MKKHASSVLKEQPKMQTRAKRQLVYEEAEDDDIEIDVQRMKDVKLTNGSG